MECTTGDRPAGSAGAGTPGDDTSEDIGGEGGVGPGAGDPCRVFDIHRAGADADSDLTRSESEEDVTPEAALCGQKRQREDELFRPATIGSRAAPVVMEAARRVAALQQG